jgi:hypothetical protein
MVAIGTPVPGAAIAITYPGAGSPFVPLLVETGVAELVAAELWRRRVAGGDSDLVGD